MCSVDETSEREMKGSEDITHARVIDSRLIYLEKISFFVRDNHNFLKVFEIHLPWWYFETLYNEIPSYHRPKLFFTSEFLFVGERKKKEKEKHWKRSKILFSPWKISSVISRKIRSMRPRITVCTICSPLFRERIQPEITSQVSILPKFLSLFKNLDFSTTQLRVDASVSREPSPTRVRLFHEPFTRRIERNTASRPENKEKRRSAARFVEIRANFSYDLKRSW